MIRVATRIALERPATHVFEGIFNVSSWTSFAGHGLIPAIKGVVITPGPNGRVGTRFEVTNADGSSHVETVTHYEAGKRMILRMDGFSRPLSALADHFIESWNVEGIELHRELQLVPRHIVGGLMLRMVKRSLRRAVEKQNQAMARPPTK